MSIDSGKTIKISDVDAEKIRNILLLLSKASDSTTKKQFCVASLMTEEDLPRLAEKFFYVHRGWERNYIDLNISEGASPTSDLENPYEDESLEWHEWNKGRSGKE